VRPYIDGLIAGLAKCGHQRGTHYQIDYRERPQLDLTKGKANEAFASKDQTPYDLIFAMSTTVVQAAKDATKSTAIVGVVSDPKAEGFSRVQNITGISARRSQSAGQCFEHFLATVPTLKQVRVLHKPKYGPSERSLKLVKAAAKKRGVAVKIVPVKTRDDIENKLSAMSKRDLKKPADAGILVLPIDVCLGWAQLIIDLAQGEKNLPVLPDRLRQPNSTRGALAAKASLSAPAACSWRTTSIKSWHSTAQRSSRSRMQAPMT
jgi:ABC-type uncharacterized transport system substrate-binding protein